MKKRELVCVSDGISYYHHKYTLRAIKGLIGKREYDNCVRCGVPKKVLKCEHKNIDRQDGLDECLDCGVRNY